MGAVIGVEAFEQAQSLFGQAPVPDAGSVLIKELKEDVQDVCRLEKSIGKFCGIKVLR